MRSLVLASFVALIVICHLADSATIKRASRSNIAKHVEHAEDLGGKLHNQKELTDMVSLLKAKISRKQVRDIETCPSDEFIELDSDGFGIFLYPSNNPEDSNDDDDNDENDEEDTTGEDEQDDGEDDDEDEEGDDDDGIDEDEQADADDDEDDEDDTTGGDEQDDGGENDDEDEEADNDDEDEQADADDDEDDEDDTTDENEQADADDDEDEEGDNDDEDEQADADDDENDEDDTTDDDEQADGGENDDEDEEEVLNDIASLFEEDNADENQEAGKYDELIKLLRRNTQRKTTGKREKRSVKVSKHLTARGTNDARTDATCSHVIETTQSVITVIVLADTCQNGEVRLYNGKDNSDENPVTVPCGQTEPVVLNTDGSVYVEYVHDSSGYYGGFGLLWIGSN